MKKILFALLLMVATVAAMSAQDEPLEQTAAPIILYQEYDEYVCVDFACEEEAVIYYVVDDGEICVYDGCSIALFRTDENQTILISAFAQAEGKAPSVTVCQVIRLAAIQPPVTIEKTVAPTILSDLDPSNYKQDITITIVNNDEDPDALIYYCLTTPDNYDNEAFVQYTEPFRLETDGVFRVIAYAVANGKEESDRAGYDGQNYHNERYYDFYVDGFYYEILSNSTVAVSKKAKDEFWYDEWINFEDPWFIVGFAYPCYSGDVVIPETVDYNGETYTVTEINDETFLDCELTSLRIPNTVTSIGKWAFGFSTLKTLIIPESVTEVGGAMIAHCYDIKSVVCKAIIPPSCDYPFPYSLGYHGASLATLFVPQESLEAYRTHEAWSEFPRIVPFIGAGPGDINGDGNIAINDVTNIIDQLLGGEDAPAYCDVNGDGVASITDMTALIDMLLNGN